MSNNRNLGNIANAITNATSGQVLTSQGSGVATFVNAGGGVTTYANKAAIDAVSSPSEGDLAFDEDKNVLYIRAASAWERIQHGGNVGPQFTTTPASTLALSSSGSTSTITAAAVDEDGFPVTYDWDGISGSTVYTASSLPNQITNVSESNGVFTLTPSTNNSHAGSFIFRTKASDGAQVSTATTNVSLAFEPVWTTGSQQAKIQSSDIAAGDNFGYGVSLSPDGNTAVIGSPNDNTNTGAVYVFIRSGTTWTQHSKLVANDAAQDSYFGRSVSLSGNGNYLIVGSPYTDTSGTDDGSAYIFVRDISNNTWSQQSKLLASNAEASDYFGGQVTMNFDGTYVAINATGEDTGASNAGSVYIFARSGSSWSQQAILQSPDIAVNHFFGISIDINSDASYLIVGERSAVSGVSYAGAAYIFTRSGSTWTQQAKLVAPNPTAYASFANTVRINSDATIAAMRETPSADGSVYIFTRSGSSWSQEAQITVGTSSSQFGFNIDLSDDGVFLLVGARRDSTTASDGGAVYIFKRSGTSWTQQIKFESSDVEASDFFGSYIALSGNGYTAIIGVNSEDTGGSNAGSAYVFQSG